MQTSRPADRIVQPLQLKMVLPCVRCQRSEQQLSDGYMNTLRSFILGKGTACQASSACCVLVHTAGMSQTHVL
jgi:hypothetical protein